MALSVTCALSANPRPLAGVPPYEDRTFLPAHLQADTPSDCPTAQASFQYGIYNETGTVRRVFIQSFGCRASQADGASIEASLEDSGWTPVRQADQADLVVLNTCTVTQAADTDARRVVRNIHRDYPNAEVLVTGCYAQRAPQELAKLDGFRWVVGNSHKTQIADIVSPASEAYHGRIAVGDIGGVFSASAVRNIREDRTRPNLKVQDGCGNKCAFCIIPSVRGRSRSAALESVLAQISGMSGRYAEVVLSGINLGRWGRDLNGDRRFVDLLRAVMRETTVQCLRISSVEPMDWSSELLHFMASEPRIARHVHMPLQSGSDAVLKRMFRKYRTRHYASRVELAHLLMPEAAIGADVMTGFPGETETEFEETYRFIEQQPFTYLHVFTYSERPGTAAADYAGAVPPPVKQERTGRLRELSDRKNLAFRQRMPGKTLSAVTLEQPGMALTTNFLKVEMAQRREPNRLITLAIGRLTAAGLREQELLQIIQPVNVTLAV